MKYYFESIGVAAMIAALISGSASAAFVGSASDYSVFLFGDLRYHHSDAQGSVYVGGNAELAHFRIGVDSELARGRKSNLAVRGTLNFSDGSIDGDLTYGDSLTLNRVSVGGQTRSGDFHAFEPGPGFYQDLSARWAQQQGAAYSMTAWGELTLTAGGGDTYFNLRPDDLRMFNKVNIDLQDDSNVTINLLGDGWRLHDLGFFLNGQLVDEHTDPGAAFADRIVLNFAEARTVQLGGPGGIGLPASILAPHADIVGFNGQMFGDLVARSFSDGGATLDQGRFQFNEPVPVPGALLLFASGLLLLRRAVRR